MQNNPVTLTPAGNDDPELRKLIEEQQDLLEHLSETRVYAVPMTGQLSYRIEKGNRLIGEALFKSIRWFNRKAQISIYLVPGERGKGYGTMVLDSLFDLAFNELDLHRLEAEVYEYNIASIKLLEKSGFKQEGRFREAKNFNGRYFDILCFGLLKKEYTDH